LPSTRAIETRLLPSSLTATHRGFAFYVAFPKSFIQPLGLPIYVARVPAAPFASRQPNVEIGVARRLLEFSAVISFF
jgi:hypothetical protein